MVRPAPLAHMVLDVLNAVGPLGIPIRVLERHLFVPGKRAGANRVRDRQCPVNGAPGSDGCLGLLTWG